MSLGRQFGILCAVTLLASCASTDAYDFEVAFSAAVQRSRVATVHTEVRQLGCSGVSVYTVDLGPDGRPIGAAGGGGSSGHDLSPGIYGFAASARDSACVVFAEGCVEVVLPDATSPVVVPVSPTTEGPQCDSTECVVGLCTGIGAGACTPSCSAGFVCCGTECCAGTCGACGTGL